MASIKKIKRPKDGIIAEEPGKGRIRIFPFFGDSGANENRLGIRGTAIVLSYREAKNLLWELIKWEFLCLTGRRKNFYTN